MDRMGEETRNRVGAGGHACASEADPVSATVTAGVAPATPARTVNFSDRPSGLQTATTGTPKRPPVPRLHANRSASPPPGLYPTPRWESPGTASQANFCGGASFKERSATGEDEHALPGAPDADEGDVEGEEEEKKRKERKRRRRKEKREKRVEEG